MFIRFILLILVSFPVFAGELDDKKIAQKKERENYCLDIQAEIDNEKVARKSPTDERIVSLVALRIGLCDLLSKNIIELDFAINLFNAERTKKVYKRIQEEQTTSYEIGA